MVSVITFIIMAIGSLNWLCIGVLQYDFIAGLFGSQANVFSRIIYAIIGISAFFVCFALIKGKGKLKLEKKIKKNKLNPLNSDNFTEQNNQPQPPQSPQNNAYPQTIYIPNGQPVQQVPNNQPYYQKQPITQTPVQPQPQNQTQTGFNADNSKVE